MDRSNPGWIGVTPGWIGATPGWIGVILDG